MILSQAVEQYILHKRSLGIGFRSEAVRLRAFIQAIGDCEMHLIEPAPVLRFLEGSGPLTTFWFSKYVETVTESAQQVAFLRIAQRSASRAIHIHPDPSRSLFRLLRSRRAAIRNGASCATPLADLSPVRNSCP